MLSVYEDSEPARLAALLKARYGLDDKQVGLSGALHDCNFQACSISFFK